MNAPAGSHLELHLQQAVDRLRAHVSLMGAMAIRAVERAGNALLNRNVTEASAVILRDRLLDQHEADGERLGLEFLVRHQPAGRTLRFVHASLRIVRELERIGDCAESVARQTLRIHRLDPPPELAPFAEQSALAIDMLQRALQAYRDEDESLARQTIPVEDAADQLRDQIRDRLLDRQRAGQLSVPGLTTLLTIARRLERITDQAKNICEEVVFLCTGQLLRHPHADAFRILFVDDTHACLGHLAEAIARRAADDRFVFHSAGMRPGPPDPRTRDFLQRRGVDIRTLTSRSLGQVPSPEEHHLVIALSEVARSVFPLAPSKTLCLDWPTPDPTTLSDSGAGDEGWDTAWRSLEQRLHPLLQAIGHD
ncbi:MAG: phosphate signaling complex protein PhoU [Verrucomicrobiae bacterium]|nr:phosphate signaling complex protein PhoU [Verrucomicrobiae bacterium]